MEVDTVLSAEALMLGKALIQRWEVNWRREATEEVLRS